MYSYRMFFVVFAVFILECQFADSVDLVTDLIEQLRPTISTSMSSTSIYNNPTTTWFSSNAIDNVNKGNPNTCSCCAGTTEEQSPWLQLDLGQTFSIRSINMYGRTDESSPEQYENLYVFVGNTPMQSTNGTLVYNGNPNNGSYTFSIAFVTPRSFRYLIIKRFTLSSITICEVKLDIVQSYSTSQSSIFTNNPGLYDSSKAIDRQKTYNIDKCMCCSVTMGTPSPSWWQLNFGHKYQVTMVEVFGRASGPLNQLHGAEIYASNSPMRTGLGSAEKIFTVPNNGTSRHFTHHLDRSVTAQYFIVTLTQTLTLCEFIVYGTGPICDAGHFSHDCLLECHCADRKPCHVTSGVCQSNICLPGWKGVACDKACGDGYYGQNCTEVCSGHCRGGNSQCNNINGKCDKECADGYLGERCNQTCTPSSYGANCSYICSTCKNKNCRNTDGLCSMGCEPGYKHGNLYCNTTCGAGTYGQNCSFNCSTHCREGNTQCDTTNGTCKKGCDKGYLGEYCNSTCEHGRYGFGCNETCNQCKTGTTCNFQSGYCPDGCMPGYNGSLCNLECPKGYFGDCTHSCHCMHNSVCEKTNGSCPNDCDIGWAGSNCSLDLNLVERISNVSTNQSGMYKTYDSSKAIDRKERYDVDRCNCCSVANGAPTSSSWWQIDLGEKYLIYAIRVYGRGDLGSTGNSQLEHSNISAGNVTLTMKNTPEIQVYQIPTITNTTVFTTILNESTIAQFIIVRHSTATLTICEFKVYEKVCDIGHFGAGCSHQCHCLDGNHCNSVDGNCQTHGCFPGWRGDSCEQECEARHFGAECNEICHCINQTNCDHVNGTCEKLECDPGWIGESCSTICTFGKFGSGCNSTCHCINNSACNNINGACDIAECDPGWKGTACNQECAVEKFGQDCKFTCHCIDNTVCNNENGTCYSGECEAGWLGEACDKDMNILRYRSDLIITSMSSVVSNWTADKAIDGLIGPNPETCHCCSGTHNALMSWWRADLREFMPVDRILIYSRNKEADYRQLEGFQLILSNNISYHAASFMSNNGRMSSKIYEIKLPNILTRIIKIQRPGTLTLCEISVFKGVCGVGHFGHTCGHSCHCADNKPCDAVTGQCQSNACKTGWRGKSCSEKCPVDTFGDECSGKCYCKGTTCTHTYGVCPGECRVGYHGPHCSQVGSEKQQGEKTANNNGSAIIGSLSGVGALFVIGVIVFIYVYRSRRKKRESSKNEYTSTNMYVTSTESDEYDTLDNINDVRGEEHHAYENEEISNL